MKAVNEKHYVSLDVGGTFIKHAAIDKSGQMIHSSKVPTPDNLTDFIAAINEIVRSYLPNIRAICFSCPGKIDTQSGTVYFGGALVYLDKFSIKKHIEQEFEIPCTVINDGKAAALAELWQGQLKEIKNGGVLTLGTGVGCGLVINGALLEGNHFQAGEVSFMLLSTKEPFEFTEIAGAKGSAVLFIERASQLLGLSENDGKTVFKELEKKNPLIQPVFEEYCRNIALIITNIQTVVDMERIAIGGGISEQPLMIEEIRRQYQLLRDTSMGFLEMLTPIKIVACAFRNEAGLLGALYHLLTQIETHQIEQEI
ncbi:ROK family protein [Isobaculum melis]|uniref:Sugar kinase of the NBD/HSP70 family, may contain an N-terminal HTH domain n=1 Tax=Isobaculum melis TaxID=142588 RepID=A0A1H9Q3U9_9LACT|nr:ROK family protein [Isobaculum melis]SER54765.1 Sugar kinase of the NBD/HSP70 family, may contain an N-terminal HTH domain [Isobaculum melis]